jgi:NlpC/P60 family putative phage cell wall peptidase
MSWVGTRFAHGASLKGVGVDCIHLVESVFRAVGLVPEGLLPSYPPDWYVHQRRELLIEGLRGHCDEAQEPWEVGDIFVYRYGRAASHCGIYVGDDQVIHAATRDKVRCDQIDSRPLAARFVAAFRVRQI